MKTAVACNACSEFLLPLCVATSLVTTENRFRQWICCELFPPISKCQLCPRHCVLVCHSELLLVPAEFRPFSTSSSQSKQATIWQQHVSLERAALCDGAEHQLEDVWACKRVSGRWHNRPCLCHESSVLPVYHLPRQQQNQSGGKLQLARTNTVIFPCRSSHVLRLSMASFADMTLLFWLDFWEFQLLPGPCAVPRPQVTLPRPTDGAGASGELRERPVLRAFYLDFLRDRNHYWHCLAFSVCGCFSSTQTVLGQLSIRPQCRVGFLPVSLFPSLKISRLHHAAVVDRSNS